MNKLKVLSCAVVLCLFGFGCSGEAAFEVSKIQETGSNKTALELYKTINKSKVAENIFFSPYSIRTAFGMLYEGARGDTAKELENIFAFNANEKKRLSSMRSELKNYNSMMSNGYGIQVANSFWANQDITVKPPYKTVLKDYYFAQFETMDVEKPKESSEKINAWVNDKTKGRISEIISDDNIKENTLAVLVNAIYFKAKWLIPFESGKTKKRDFYISKDSEIEVNMMFNDKDIFGYLENDKVQVLKMQYEQAKNMPPISMIVVLPKENNITDAENYIYSNKISKIQKSFEFPKVIVYFPKLELEWEMEMLDTIISMGLNNAKPDYSKIFDEKFGISGVLHKAFIKIDEKETEAAAVTAIVMGKTMALTEEPEPKVFKADHPFMYLIVDDDTNQILFMGKMLNPGN